VVVDGLDRFVEQPADVPAARPVDRPASVATSRHQPGQSQLGQVLRHRGAGDPHRRGQGGDVVLVAAQQPEHLHPGAVGEHPEDVHGGVDVLASR
jgi:hypothetical protein